MVAKNMPFDMAFKIKAPAGPRNAANAGSGSDSEVGRRNRDFRGRDASHPAPPAQIRTGPIRAYGSHLGCLTTKRLSGHG